MSSEIVLFDLPSQGRCACWSLNPWKARLALNYKGLPYKTEWVEYPDIKPKFQALGIPPNDPKVNPNADYSCPCILISGGEFVMDSLAIAKALEKLQPEPSLHLDSGYTDRCQTAVLETQKAIMPIAVARIPAKVLNEASARYFSETREKRFGMPLPELAQSEKAQNAWTNAQPGIDELKAILHEHEEGPYVMGKTVSFADFIVAGLWRFVEILDEGGDLFERGMKMDEAFTKHYEACGEWLRRDDH